MAYNEKLADRAREIIFLTQKKQKKKECLAGFVLWLMI